MVTLNERLEKVATLRATGHNCAQCVMMAFTDKFSKQIPLESLEAISCAYGGGVAGTGHICGAASSMAAVISLMRYNTAKDKVAVYKEGATVMTRFIAMQNGNSDCRTLRVPGAKPCGKLIEEAVTALHNYLEETDAR